MGMSARIAAFTRRSPALITRSPSTSRTTGGWMMPIAVIDASNWSSIACGAGVLRGLFGLGFSVRGSTLRSSAMVSSWLDGSSSPVLGETLPAGRIVPVRGKGEAGEAGHARGCARDPCGGRHRSGTSSVQNRAACWSVDGLRLVGFGGVPGCRIGVGAISGALPPSYFCWRRRSISRSAFSTSAARRAR